VIDEKSLVVARMFNLIDNKLRSITHSKQFFDGVDVIMTSDFYQTPPMKDS
jgi:hypothetical protein